MTVDPAKRDRVLAAAAEVYAARSIANAGKREISEAADVPLRVVNEVGQHRIDLLRQEVEDYYSAFRVTPDLIELRNLVEVADLIVRSALARKESRGLHYNTDYPMMLPEAKDTVLVP